MTRVLLLPTALLLGLVLIFFLASADRGPARSAVVYCSDGEIHTLDIHAMSWTQDIRVAMALWEGLCAYDPKTLHPRPGVAESWDISDDRRTYTFHLRPNARWSNGDPVTASDFIATWQRALDPATGTEYRDLFFLIQGAKAYSDAAEAAQKAGRPRPSFDMVAVRAPNPRTLVITLENPTAYFLDLMCFTPFYPLNLKSMERFAIDKADPLKGYDAHWTRPPNLVSNGPFVLTDWRFKQYLMFEPNPRYWDRAAVQVRRIKHVAYEDQQAAYLAYSTGVIDILSFVPQSFAPELLAQQSAGQRHDIKYGPVFGTYYYLFNCQRKPFDDPRVRMAFALVIDKQKLVDHVTRMQQRPVNVLVPPGAIPGYSSPKGLDRDVARAQKLLADAGYPNGQGLREVEFLYNKAAIHLDVAQAVGQMWQDNLGVRIAYKGVETKTFSTERRASNFDIARGGWYGDYMDPTTWLDLARTDNPNNNGKYADPAFDALLDQARKEPDVAKRFTLLHAAEKRLVEETMPFIPLYQYADGSMYDPSKLAGCEPNIRMLTQFKYIHRLK